ncbi:MULTISPECIES: hypothetical protein [Variovorax]|jgi:hypothetical protein|uniref:hypothetical protein n=1 Tax=Variovorax TaxID=34072 RepID=UPI00092840C7|nr:MULTISPECIES: hypothetical protein [Variovorax]OJZ08060.1 MAG: hypothetical protein BGP22_08160 [Variovorax sp. 67-131]UKI10790.1 hypothetical protein L3V85_13360 [Variovorax paradoxus]
MTRFLDIVPSWLWALLLLLAVAVAGIERTQVLKAKAETSAAQKAVSDEKLDRQSENTRRALAALDDLRRVLAMQAGHAKNQQENFDAYEQKVAALDVRRRAAAGDVERVRQQYAAYAARDRDQAATDPAACVRIADRSAVFAGMAARGRELLERGRLIVEQRDAEVGVLLRIVRNDRNLIAE